MRQDVIDLAQSAIWDGLGDAVEVFAPGADVATDAPTWTGLAVRIVPEGSTRPPGRHSATSNRFGGFRSAWTARQS